MWHSARASTGSDRSRLQPPSAVSVASSACDQAVVVEADPPLGVEAVPLAGHGEVLGAVEPQPDRPAGERWLPSAAIAAKPCGCISLPPKPPPIRRHCTVISWLCQPSTWATISWVSDGCWVLDCTKICPPSSTMGQGAVGLQVEVLLPGELELAGEHVLAAREPGLDVAALDGAAVRPGSSRPRSPP